MKKWKLSVLAFAVVGVGVAAYFFFRPSSFETIQVKKGDITEAVYGLGRVVSDQRFEVKIGIISTVEKLFVDEGDKVKKGDPLIEFESKVLFRAPFEGTVTFISTRQGESALPQSTILRLENLVNRYIELSLEQEGALRVREGQKARISFESLRGEVLEGRIKALFPRNDEFIAHVEVEGLGQNILPGMTADVAIEIGQIPDATLVPLKAVSNGVVSVRRDGRWKKVKIEVGHVDGMWAEVKDSSLQVGDEVRVRKGE